MAEYAKTAQTAGGAVRVTCSRDKRTAFPSGQKKGDAVGNPTKDGYRCTLCGADFAAVGGSHPKRS